MGADGPLDLMLVGLGELGLAVLRELLAHERFRLRIFDPVPVRAVDLGPFYRTEDLQAPKQAVVGGVTTTRYDANFDIDKTVRDTRRDRYRDKERDDLFKALDLLGLSGRVFPGTVWLDRDGLPRRFRIDLRISPRKGFVFEVGLDLQLHAFGGDEVPGTPTDLELLETDSLGSYLQAVTRGRVPG